MLDRLQGERIAWRLENKERDCRAARRVIGRDELPERPYLAKAKVSFVNRNWLALIKSASAPCPGRGSPPSSRSWCRRSADR